MTAALPWEHEPVPPPPEVSVLARILARLSQAAWASGEPQIHRLEKGLVLTAFLLDDALHLALTRDGSEPSFDEAETVARESGWPGFTHLWKRGKSGARGLVLTRASAPAANGPPTPGLSPVQRAAVLRMFLDRPRDPGTMTPEYAVTFWAARKDALEAMSDDELLEELDWLWRHWGRWMTREFAQLELLFVTKS